MTDRPKNGTACWVDLSTPDTAAAKSFYAELLGWEVSVTPSTMGDYFVASAGDREVAGMMEQPQHIKGAPPRWTVFFWADDLEVTITKVNEAGGTVLQPPFEIPGGARVAVVEDVCGAMFALISEGPEPGVYLSRDAGGVGWFELMTREPDAATRFYKAVFDWTADESDAGGITYTAFKLGELDIAGMIPTTSNVPADVPDNWSVYFNTADCKAAEKKVVELGGQVILPTTPTPMGPFAVVADSQGAVFQLMEFTDPTTGG